VVELQLFGIAELEAVFVTVMKNCLRKLGISRHDRLADTQPWLDRPFERFTAPDAEGADVIQEEVRPVLGR
jgi:hypothetical protein